MQKKLIAKKCAKRTRKFKHIKNTKHTRYAKKKKNAKNGKMKNQSIQIIKKETRKLQENYHLTAHCAFLQLNVGLQ